MICFGGDFDSTCFFSWPRYIEHGYGMLIIFLLWLDAGAAFSAKGPGVFGYLFCFNRDWNGIEIGIGNARCNWHDGMTRTC